MPAITPATMSGTLMRNAACHEKCSSSSPPTSGPTAAPRPDTAAQMLSAVARSLGSVKMTRISDSVIGMIMAPPTPSSARIAMTDSALFANSTSSEAPPKIA
jgi:hypothetical protein